jgi:hypothetical protein
MMIDGAESALPNHTLDWTAGSPSLAAAGQRERSAGVLTRRKPC